MTDILPYNQKYKTQKIIAFIFYWATFYIGGLLILLSLSAILYPEFNDLIFEEWPERAMYHISYATNFYVYLFLSIGLIALLWNYYRDELAIFKHKLWRNIGLAVSFYFIGIFGMTFINLILEIAGLSIETSQNQESIDYAMKTFTHYMIPSVLLAPLVEETIFRGILFNFFEQLDLPKRWNTILAFAASILIFAFIHVTTELFTDPLGALVIVLPYIIIGTCITIVYYMTKSLFAAVLIHFIQNFVSVVLSLLLIWLESQGFEIPAMNLFMEWLPTLPFNLFS